MSAIKRMFKVVSGRHWWELDYNAQYALETTESYQHIKRYYGGPFKKRKYYRRKSYFIKYESHRKRGVDYLPF